MIIRPKIYPPPKGLSRYMPYWMRWRFIRARAGYYEALFWAWFYDIDLEDK